MRIVIAGPPKTGNMWLKCLLGRAYGLRSLRSFETPASADLPSLRTWLADGRFPDGTIFHQHYDFAPEIADTLDAVPARLVTIVRDPYDAFVSTYYTLQQHAAEKNQKGRKFTELMGKSLDDPAIVEFLRRGGYANNLQKARDWAGSGRAVVLRYEDLSGTLSPRYGTPLRRSRPSATTACKPRSTTAEPTCMRQRTKGQQARRAATVGDSVRQLTNTTSTPSERHTPT